MKASEWIERRQSEWRELEELTKSLNRRTRLSVAQVQRFARLYRNTCADLAIANAHHASPGTIDYLQSLVARAHQQLYRPPPQTWSGLAQSLLFEMPQRVFRDPCVHVAAAIFWGLFLLSGWLAYDDRWWPGFAQRVVGASQLQDMQEMYQDFQGRSWGQDMTMAGFYVYHNAGIGLTCFAMMLLILPGLVTLCSNAVQLGAVFGFMFRPEQGATGENFQTFVTAHGPCELTAIVLAAGAGLRIGVSWLATRGQRRFDSLMINARLALPIAMCAVALFFCAAMIEGFISPAPAAVIPRWAKSLVAVLSSSVLLFYFVGLGYPREEI